jgi:hypothetical protein
MKRVRIVSLLFGILLTFSVVESEASPLYFINIGSFSGGTATLNAPGTLANGLTVVLGAVLITGDLGTFESYCVDLQHYDLMGINQTTVDSMANWNNTATPPYSPTDLGGGAASWLYQNYAANAVGHQDREAALSLAIWDALYNNVYNVTTANSGFWATNVNSSYVTLADTMLGNLQQFHGSLPQVSWLRTVNGPNNTSQDFIAPVPEPATLTLLGLGSLSALLTRHRIRRRSAHSLAEAGRSLLPL